VDKQALRSPVYEKKLCCGQGRELKAIEAVLDVQ